MPDAFGVSSQGEAGGELRPDYLGTPAAQSFRGQPALPTAGGTPGGAAPPTVGGAGAAPAATQSPKGPGAGTEPSFGDIAAMIGGDAGSEGAGSPGVGQATDAAGGPANIGLSFGVGPANLSIGPTGSIGVGARGDSPTGQGLASALNAALSFAGVPTSINVPSLVAALTSSPVLGMAAQMAGAFGLPFTITSLAHAIASMSPTSVTSLQAALANPNPEAQLTAAQALALAQGGAKGPTQGGPQGIGGLPTDNPMMGPQGAAFGLGAGHPGIAGQNQFASEMTLADLAQSIFGQPSTARSDIGAPAAAPTEAAISEADAVGGNPAGGPPSDGGATGGGTDAGEA